MTRIHVMGGNVLKRGPKISGLTRKNDTERNLFDINGRLA